MGKTRNTPPLPPAPWLDSVDADVREEAIDLVAKKLARRATVAEIGRALTVGYKVPASERPPVIAAGLARLVSWVGVPPADPRFDSLALCESVVRSNASVRECMAAQTRIDELRAEGFAPASAAPSPGGELDGLTDDDLEKQILRLEQAGETDPGEGAAQEA